MFFSPLKGNRHFIRRILHFLHFEWAKWLCFVIFVCIWVWDFFFARRWGGYLAAILWPFTSSSLLSFPFFQLFKVLTCSVLGKVVLIVIGQNSQWRGESVQLFIYLWSCQFGKKMKPLSGAIIFLFFFPTSQCLCFFLLVSLYCSASFLLPPSLLIFSSQIMFELSS